MARPIGVSPFTLDTNVYHFPDKDIGEELVVRVESGGTFKVHITVNGAEPVDDPSTTRGDYFLDSGEALVIKRGKAHKGSDIKIKAITGTPKIFYSLR